MKKLFIVPLLSIMFFACVKSSTPASSDNNEDKKDPTKQYFSMIYKINDGSSLSEIAWNGKNNITEYGVLVMMDNLQATGAKLKITKDESTPDISNITALNDELTYTIIANDSGDVLSTNTISFEKFKRNHDITSDELNNAIAKLISKDIDYFFIKYTWTNAATNKAYTFRSYPFRRLYKNGEKDDPEHVEYTPDKDQTV